MAARMARDAPSAFCRVGPRHIDSCPSKHVSAIRATSSGLVPSSTRTNATRCPSCLPIRQSCGVPSPCAGRWLRIDAAHAAMSRDGERRRCYSIRIAPATRAYASARRPVRHRCFPRGTRIRWIPAGIVHRQGAASVASSNPQRLAWSKAWKYRSFGLFALFRPCRLFQPIRPQHPAPLHRQACRVPVHCPPARRRVKPSANRAYPRSWRPIQGVQKRTSY